MHASDGLNVCPPEIGNEDHNHIDVSLDGKEIA